MHSIKSLTGTIRYMLFAGLISIVAFSCERDANPPGLLYYYVSVYKTTADYYDNVNANDLGNSMYWLSSKDPSNISITEDDTIYTRRWKLSGGYIMDNAIAFDHYFTDVKINDLVAMNDSCDGCITKEYIFQRVIDTDPFVEFYEDRDELFLIGDSSSINTLNELIEQDRLEEFLVKIK